MSAADTGKPVAIMRPAIGTDVHSHVGRAAPARPAAGIASSRRRGTIRATAAGDTNAPISADSSVPSTRNGTAWDTIATNTVARACRPGRDR